MRSIVILVVLGTGPARGQVVTYDGTSFPETVGWQRDAVLFPAERWLDNGWLVQRTEPWPEPPFEAEHDGYRRFVSEFAGAADFFVEWRLVTDGPRAAIPSGAPAGLTASGTTGIHYHFTIAADHARLIHSELEVAFFDVDAGMPHTYRLEIRGVDYNVLIDGVQVYSGVTPLSYPTPDSRVVFWGRAPAGSAMTRWDYIRYGRIPPPTDPGDTNCDSAINVFDVDPFVLALLEPAAYEAAYPDCTLTSADLNADGAVNFFDIDPFVECLFGACP